MLTIRLTRRGKKNRPFFRIVVAEARAPIRGRFIEILGYLDPLTKKVGLKKERIEYWLSQGAQPSATVHNLLVKHKIIAGPKINKFKAKKKEKGETEAATTEIAKAPIGEAQAATEDKTEEKKVEAPAPAAKKPASEKSAAEKRAETPAPAPVKQENAKPAIEAKKAEPVKETKKETTPAKAKPLP